MSEIEKQADDLVAEELITVEKPSLMQQRLYKLLSVKSIMTIMMTAVFCYLAFTGQVSAEQFCTIFMGVVAFYFGNKDGKNGKSEVAQNG